ncbi:hypothetical protein ACGC1H_002466 [Rhizoctonia solani]
MASRGPRLVESRYPHRHPEHSSTGLLLSAVFRLLTYDARANVEACDEADAPGTREHSPHGTPGAAYRALGAEPAPDATYRAPGTVEVPKTPFIESGLGLELDNDTESAYVPTYGNRVSYVDSEDEVSTAPNPQYIVIESPDIDRSFVVR